MNRPAVGAREALSTGGPRTTNSSRRAALRIQATYAAATGVVAMLILLSPPIPAGSEDGLCAQSIHLTERLSYSLNCDSSQFMTLAKDPSLLYSDRGRMWRSRPLYVWAGHVASLPFQAVTDRPLLPVWLGFVVLNAILVVAALALFHRFVQGDWSFAWSTFFVSSLLLSSDVFKAFFWSPHTQMFNLFVPSLALLAAERTLSRSALGWGRVVFIGISTGTAALAYGSFAVVAAAVAAAIAFQVRWPAAERVAKSAALLPSFAAPILVWMAIVLWRAGEFYSHEIGAFRQFVWLGDAASGGAAVLLAQSTQKLGSYAADLSRVAFLPLLLLAGVSLAGLLSARPRRPLGRDGRRRIGAALVVIVLTTGFFGLMGYTAPRLAWNSVPPILGIAAILATGIRGGRTRWALGLLLAAIALSSFIWQVVKAGPYS